MMCGRDATAYLYRTLVFLNDLQAHPESQAGAGNAFRGDEGFEHPVQGFPGFAWPAGIEYISGGISPNGQVL